MLRIITDNALENIVAERMRQRFAEEKARRQRLRKAYEDVSVDISNAVGIIQSELNVMDSAPRNLWVKDFIDSNGYFKYILRRAHNNKKLNPGHYVAPLTVAKKLQDYLDDNESFSRFRLKIHVHEKAGSDFYAILVQNLGLRGDL